MKVTDEGRSKLVGDLNFYLRTRSQAELGKMVGISQATLSRILTHQTKQLHCSTLRKICFGLGFDIIRYSSASGLNVPQFVPSEDLVKSAMGIFNGVYAYNVPNGLTYVGRYKDGTLDGACMFPTISIASEESIRNVSAVVVIREMYQRKCNTGQPLDKYQNFSRLEANAASLDLSLNE